MADCVSMQRQIVTAASLHPLQGGNFLISTGRRPSSHRRISCAAVYMHHRTKQATTYHTRYPDTANAMVQMVDYTNTHDQWAQTIAQRKPHVEPGTPISENQQHRHPFVASPWPTQSPLPDTSPDPQVRSSRPSLITLKCFRCSAVLYGMLNSPIRRAHGWRVDMSLVPRGHVGGSEGTGKQEHHSTIA